MFALFFEFGVLGKIILSHVPFDLNDGAVEVNFIADELFTPFVLDDLTDTDQFGDIVLVGSEMVDFNEFANLVDESLILDLFVGS